MIASSGPCTIFGPLFQTIVPTRRNEVSPSSNWPADRSVAATQLPVGELARLPTTVQ